MTATRPLRGAGIGSGYFAPFQYEAWTRIPEVSIVAIHNRTESRARAIMRDYGVPRYYDDWRTMLESERPDFVDVITPPETHLEICEFAAGLGIHVICQKPLAPTFEEGARIVALAKAAGIRFMVHENFRWQPWYRTIKSLQQEGRIGEFTHAHFLMRMGDGWAPDAYLARQPFFRSYPRLLVYETGVHFIDTFRFLFGEVVSVFAHLRRLNPDIAGEDAGQIFLRFSSGATAIWDANRYNETEAESPRFTFGQLRIDGARGHLTMDADANLRVKVLGQPDVLVDYAHERRNFAGDCVYFLERHFVDCMTSGREFESNGDDYLRTMRVVEAAYQSAAEGRVVALPSVS